MSVETSFGALLLRKVTPYTPRDAIGQLVELGAGRGLHPAKPNRSIGSFNIYPVKE